MSKAKVRAVLNEMSKEDVIKMILELYSAHKDVKTYLDFYAEPDEEGLLENYKKVIESEFVYVKRFPRMRFSVARKAIADYRRLHPRPEFLADLMLYLVELSIELAFDTGIASDSYFKSVSSNFVAACKYIYEKDLFEAFKTRLAHCEKQGQHIGWGWGFVMSDCYEDLFGDRLD